MVPWPKPKPSSYARCIDRMTVFWVLVMGFCLGGVIALGTTIYIWPNGCINNQ